MTRATTAARPLCALCLLTWCYGSHCNSEWAVVNSYAPGLYYGSIVYDVYAYGRNINEEFSRTENVYEEDAFYKYKCLKKSVIRDGFGEDKHSHSKEVGKLAVGSIVKVIERRSNGKTMRLRYHSEHHAHDVWVSEHQGKDHHVCLERIGTWFDPDVPRTVKEIVTFTGEKAWQGTVKFDVSLFDVDQQNMHDSTDPGKPNGDWIKCDTKGHPVPYLPKSSPFHVARDHRGHFTKLQERYTSVENEELFGESATCMFVLAAGRTDALPFGYCSEKFTAINFYQFLTMMSKQDNSYIFEDWANADILELVALSAMLGNHAIVRLLLFDSPALLSV